MATLAVKTAKWTLDIASRIIKAEVRLHHPERASSDLAAIFVVNHFTRLETLLLPYQFYTELGLETRSLAADELFVGRLAPILRSMGAVSTKEPERDSMIIRSLLLGDHPWIIFPEGAMIKDKKVVGDGGHFEVFNGTVRRPPHRGAAVLAMRAEICRRRLRALREARDHASMEETLRSLGLSSQEAISEKRIAIVPVNITYFPLRSDENALLHLVQRYAGEDLTPRAVEELSMEGTVLSRETDIDITIGEPIAIGNFLGEDVFAEARGVSVSELEHIQRDPSSKFAAAAQRLTESYMRAIYGCTTLNADHAIATVLRSMPRSTLSEPALRRRAYWCCRGLLRTAPDRCHAGLSAAAETFLVPSKAGRFDDFLDLCLREGALERRDGLLEIQGEAPPNDAEFHEARSKRLAYVIANEAEPVEECRRAARYAAWMPHPVLRRRIVRALAREAEHEFNVDYISRYAPEYTKGPEVGRPFLLKPLAPRAGIVLVHGYMAAPLEVRAMAEYLYELGYAVYGVRLKGHGTSPSDLAATPWRAWCASVDRGLALMHGLCDQVIVGGFSMGAGLALLTGGRHRDGVAAVFAIDPPLILRSAAARFAPSVVRVNSFLRKVRWAKPGWEYIENAPENKHINYTSNPISGVAELKAAMAAMETELANISAPTLVVMGSDDPTVHPDSGKAVFDRIGTPLKELSIVCRDRHGIINGPGAEDIFERVGRFLSWAERIQGDGGTTPDTRAPKA